MKVIGLVGPRLSGKNLFAYYLRGEYGFRVLDFTINILAPLLRKGGKEPTRENLLRAATKLRKKEGIDVLARMLCKRIREGRNYVIAGVRFPEEVIYLEKQFGVDFILVGVECGPKIRYERARRKNVKEGKRANYWNFIRKERLPTESIITETVKLSRFTVKNEGEKEDLYAKIDKLMEKIYISKTKR